MSSLILLRGLPSHATAIQVADWAGRLRAEVLRPADFRARLMSAVTPEPDDAALRQALRRRAEELLAAGVAVLVDAPHSTAAQVDQWRSIAARTAATVRILEIVVPLTVALADNAAQADPLPVGAIQRWAAQLAVPLPPAGWYTILVVAVEIVEEPAAEIVAVPVAAEYVTISEAARRTGRPPRSISTLADRYRVRVQLDPTAPNPRRGRRKVHWGDVQAWFASIADA